MCLSPCSESPSQKLSVNAWRFEQSLSKRNPLSVTWELERSTASKDGPWEDMTSIQPSCTPPGYSAKYMSFHTIQTSHKQDGHYNFNAKY